MKIAALIEARLRSTRLPGKVLLPILGQPMLGHMVERVRRARLLDEVILATTDQPADDALADFGRDRGLPVFRGSETDVLQRVLHAAQRHQVDVIVELTGDCPLHDPALIDKVVADFLLGGADFVCNILPYSTPRGTDVRVFRTEALAEVDRLTRDPADHEHVSLYFWEHPERYRLRNVVTALPDSAAGLRLTVDTPEDFELVRRTYEALHPRNPAFTLTEVLAWLASHPETAALNQAIQQKPVR